MFTKEEYTKFIFYEYDAGKASWVLRDSCL